MNYGELFKTVQGYLENDFPLFTANSSSGTGTVSFTAKEQINTFIKQAEQRIYNSVQFPNFRVNSSGTLTGGNNQFVTPANFLAAYEFSVTNPANNYQEFLLNKDVNYIRAAYPLDDAFTQGVPKYYALFSANTSGTTLLLAPTPASDYAYQLNYFAYPDSIVPPSNVTDPATIAAYTSWLGNNFDSALLYGALVEGYTYMKGEADIIAAYTKRYEEAMILVKRLGDGMDRRDAYRSGQIRMTVN